MPLLLFNITILLLTIFGAILFRKKLATRILNESLETDKNEYPVDVFDKMVMLIGRAIFGFMISFPALGILQIFYLQSPVVLSYLPFSIPMGVAAVVGFLLFVTSLYESSRVNSRAHRDGLIRTRNNISKQDS